MAALVTTTMGGLNEGQSSVYPLFHKGSKPREAYIDANAGPSHTHSDHYSLNIASQQSEQKEWKPNATNNGSGQQSQAANGDTRLNGGAQAELLDVDPNSERRKRRKTASPEREALAGDNKERQSARQLPGQEDAQRRAPEPKATLSISRDNQNCMTSTEAKVQIKAKDDSRVRNVLATIISEEGTERDLPPACHLPSVPAKDSMPTASSDLSATAAVFDSDKPKKVLKLNPKTGTIGSPPAKKSTTGGKTLARKKKTGTSLLVIRYGPGFRLPLDIGHRIEQIMKAPPNVARIALKTVSVSPSSSQTLPKEPKSIHPLFLGKSATKAASSQGSLTSEPGMNPNGQKEQSTIGKPLDRSHNRQKSSSRPGLNSLSTLDGAAKVLKFPAAINPAWPWRGMVHIRGHPNGPDADRTNKLPNVKVRVQSGKRGKYPAVQVQSQENVIQRLASSLSIRELVRKIQEINLDEFPPLPHSLRVPTKQHETNAQIRRQIQKQLHYRLAAQTSVESSDDEPLSCEPNRRPPHSALAKVYGLLATSMSAFDQGQCENQAWIQKYSPTCATDVLQVGREAMILKDWMQTLVVQSVEVRGADVTNSRASSLSRASSKLDLNGKRKRKSKNLDGFVVSSDEETDDLDEISEPEDFVSRPGSQGSLKKTLVTSRARRNKEPGKFRNTVLISGPHGCGKTASVYAVAKELDFEIFEINSSSRRSGKDIMEKVGNMTQNHLVQQHNVPASVSVDEDSQSIDEALENDIRSGRQGTMNSFFKPQQQAASGHVNSKSVKPSTTLHPPKDKSTPKGPPKRQKQSLILIEEVDVLYEEDKQFWSTVMALIAQSKRPIIMTCNDESLVPLLPLHAIIRFNPPPIHLAVDYMLLIAACEGHILDRDAVRGLYESRNMDLRASLTELNYWCQFAVGDQKHGLGWFYRRAATDQNDQQHDQVRVVSESTYQTGMGWYSQDVIESRMSSLDLEAELLHEAWEGWQLDAGNMNVQLPLADWAESLSKPASKASSHLSALQSYENFTETMSSIDLCCGSSFAAEFQVHIDSSLPELTQKAREDFIIAFPLLEASPVDRHNVLGKDISMWLKTHCHNFLQVDQHVRHSLDACTGLRAQNEGDFMRLIRDRIYKTEASLSRYDLSLAFDPISEPEKSSLHTSGHLEASCFDRTKAVITEDVAPYVRSIVSYDVRLQQDRSRLNSLVSDGGRGGKRMRTTRAAMSALEGGARSTTRRDRYFSAELNPNFVLRTGKSSWLEAAADEYMNMMEHNESSRSSLNDLIGDRSGIVGEEEHVADI